jgi:hypothetical protein
MMRFRGSDDDVIGFGHFSETRKVKPGPDDAVPNQADEGAFDDYSMKEMMKKGANKSGRIDPRSLKNGGGVNRFANSRCRPPGSNNNKPKGPVPDAGGGGHGDGGKGKDKFHNTGW